MHKVQIDCKQLGVYWNDKSCAIIRWMFPVKMLRYIWLFDVYTKQVLKESSITAVSNRWKFSWNWITLTLLPHIKQLRSLLLEILIGQQGKKRVSVYNYDLNVHEYRNLDALIFLMLKTMDGNLLVFLLMYMIRCFFLFYWEVHEKVKI